MRALPSVLISALWFSACGGGGDAPSGPGPGLSVSGSGAVTVPSGGTATSTVTIARSGGFEGAVSLVVSGLPTVITGSISPSVVPSGTSTATITWTAVAGAPVGAHTVTVQATASGVPMSSTTIPLSISAQPPAAIALLAGDNQSVASGEPVPVVPRVIVRDVQGRPVAGVTVTFTRDSGSSQLVDSIRMTAADGIAQLGAWRPGPGRNVIRAVVASLPAVMFRAEGTGTMTLGDQTVPVGGGTITVSRAGNPLDGLQIVVPAQAFAQPLRAVVQYGEPAPVPGRAGTIPITPPITISGDRGGLANAPLTIRVPARVARTAFPVAVIRNLTTGAFQTVPAIASDSATVTVLLQSFDGALIAAPPTPSSSFGAVKRPAAMRSSNGPDEDLQRFSLQMIIGAVPYDALTKELDTGYRPAVDNWEFDQLMSKLQPSQRYTNGLPLAAAWYFDHFKASRGALLGRFQETPGVELSNVQGMRLANELNMLRHFTAIGTYNGSVAALASYAKISDDSAKLLILKAAIHQTGRPQALQGFASGDFVSSTVLVYRVNGNVLDVTLGTSTQGAANAGTITLTNGTLRPLLFSIRDFDTGEQVPVNLSQYFLTGQSGFSAAEMNALWQDVFAERVGEGKYPSWYLASSDEPHIADDTIWVAEDTVRFWAECACEEGWEPENGIKPTARMATAGIYLKEGATFTSWEKAIRGKGLVAKETHDGKQVGFAIGERYDGTRSSFIDWTVAVIKVRRLTVTPAASTQSADTKFTITADISRALPSGATWEFELGDGRTLTSNSKEIQVEYPPASSGDQATYTIKARIKKDGKAWASGKTTVTIESKPEPFWKLTKFEDLDNLVDPPGTDEGQGGPLFDFLWGAESVPNSALVVITGNSLSMRVKRAGVWTACCPPPFGSDDYVWSWPTWSQSSTDLKSGTVTGLQTEGPSEFRFEATRNGKLMTGTLTLKVSKVDSEGKPDVSTYRMKFEAERMR